MATSTTTKKDDTVVGVARPERRTPAARKLYSSNRTWLVPVFSVAVFLGIWQLIGSHVNPILFATPYAVIQSLVSLLKGGILEPAWLRAMESLIIGLGLATIVGTGVGVAMGRNDTISRALNPYVNFFMATPLVAMVPLVVIWVGIGLPAEITVTFIIGVWSIIINTAEGIKSTPVPLLEMARVYRISERSVIRNVAYPYALPYVYAGMRIAIGKSLVGVIIAEMDISLKGLGGLVVLYGDAFNTSALLAIIICSAMVGVICTILLDVLRRRTTPWDTHRTDRGRQS